MQIEHASTKKTEGRAKTVLFRVSVCLLSVALALALVSAVLIYLARQDDNAGRYSFEREVSLNFIMAGVAAAWTGQEVEVLPEDVNGLLNLLLQEQAARGEEGEFVLCGVCLEPDEAGDALRFYAPVRYQGRDLGVTGRTRIVFDSAVQRLEFRLSDLRVGRLPLPTGLVLGAVDDLLPEGLHVEGDSLFLDASLLRVELGGTAVPFSLQSLRVEDGAVKVQTAAVRDELKAFVQEKLSEALGGSGLDLEGLTGGLGGLLDGWLQGRE